MQTHTHANINKAIHKNSTDKNTHTHKRKQKEKIKTEQNKKHPNNERKKGRWVQSPSLYLTVPEQARRHNTFLPPSADREHTQQQANAYITVKVYATNGPLHGLHDAQKSRLLLPLIRATMGTEGRGAVAGIVQAFHPQWDWQDQAAAVQHFHLQKGRIDPWSHWIQAAGELKKVWAFFLKDWSLITLNTAW